MVSNFEKRSPQAHQLIPVVLSHKVGDPRKSVLKGSKLQHKSQYTNKITVTEIRGTS